MSACPVCGTPDPSAFIDAGTVPVECTSMHDDRVGAMSVAMGDMRLVLCAHCATVTNSAFDETLIDYDGSYENSQLFSPTFRSFAAELADRLIVDRGLRGRPVVEVGSGKGEFLAMLAEAGSGRATGYDPTYEGEVDHLDQSLDVHLIRTMFDETTVEELPGLVCARHVLEHVADPVSMLASIRAAVSGDPSCLLYVEVPDSSFTFTDAGLWDIIYQHCSYFSAASLAWIADAAGFEVVDLRSVFGDQFLSLDARPTSVQAELDVERVTRTVDKLTSFAGDYERAVERWREQMDRWTHEGRRVALWGGGAKGVTFLNLVGGAVDSVVDLNVRKHGKYLPGTGHEVIAPESLPAVSPDVVIVMNAAYVPEITADLEAAGLRPEIALA